MEDREGDLGFVPQKDSPYNKHLPYNDAIDKESTEQLSLIKANLGRTVQLRDIKIGATHWIAQLSR